MPQLEQIDTYAGQVFWLAVTFVLLYLLLWRSALPRIARVLTARQDRIDDDLRKAGALRDEAGRALRAYEEATAGARAEAQEILRAGAEASAGRAAERSAESSRRIAGETAASEARIEAATAEALAGVREMAGEIAEAAAARLLGEAPDRKAVEAAVDSVMAEGR